MSVLTCPVCKGTMKEISKGGVLIDTCTLCRGVWLDRGELEKLASVVGGGNERGFLAGAMSQRRHDHGREDVDDEDDDRRRSHGRSGKSRRSFLDFFD